MKEHIYILIPQADRPVALIRDLQYYKLYYSTFFTKKETVMYSHITVLLPHPILQKSRHPQYALRVLRASQHLNHA